MSTIKNYLKQYKDYSFNELSWNKIDNLFLSILVYMPVNSFDYMNYNDLVLEILKNKKIDTKDVMIPMVIKLIEIVKDSKRYQDLKFINFINRVDEYTQFGAFTVLARNKKIICFKGTDRSVIGWLENFRLAYMYPTYTQELAIKYLKNNISIFDKNIYVCGHSKGGNLAIISSMELSYFKSKKIKQIYNFDGPGLKLKEFKSNKYKRIKNRIINIIPTGSYIGTILYNENYHVIKTSSLAINEHYPVYWNILNTEFVKGNISKLSVGLIKRTTVNLSEIDELKLKEIFETTFQIFNNKETKDIKISLTDIINLFKTVNKMDDDLSKYIFTIIKTMIKLSNNKE